MSRTALYQKYRSQNFDEIVGQEYVVKSIKNAIRDGKIGHAYLFCGPRGTGKTSMARLLAKAVTCENPTEAPCGHCESCIMATEGRHPDIVEINAANETHVEDIRDLIERSRLAPMISKHKIYIIDEVHQLSSSAASALLKTLEEPPEHVIFVLATTDPQKLINTIISRCQRFDFTKVNTEQIKNHLLYIAGQEDFTLEENAARKIAELADGGLRDALSILEQVSSYSEGNITEEEINRVYGLASTEQKLRLLNCILDHDLAGILENIQEYEHAGMDLKKLTTDLIDCLKDSVIWNYTKKENTLRVLNGQEASGIANKTSPDVLLKMADRFIEANNQYRSGQSVTTILEIACMELLAGNEEKVHNNAYSVTPTQVTKQAVNIPAPPTTPIQKETTPTPSSNTVEEPLSPIPAVETIDEEVLNEPMTIEPEPLPEPDPEVRMTPQFEPVTLTVNDVLALLVQCDKDHKVEDTLTFMRVTSGIPTDRYMAALKQVEIKASGADCTILACTDDVVADTINDPEFNRELYFWMKTNGIDRMPFAITNDMYNDAVQEFVTCRKTNSLPQPRNIQRYQVEKKEETIEDDPLKRVTDLFGDQVEIVEGE